MNAYGQPSGLSRHVPGLLVVLLFHAALIYALMNGLSHKLVEVVRQTVEARIVEAKPEPAPATPKAVQPEPPKPKPLPRVPVPDVKPAPQTVPQPAITAAPMEAAPQPTSSPPAAPTTTAAPEPAAATAAPPSVAVSCPGYRQTLIDAGFPREATRAGVESGQALVSFTISPNGSVKDVAIVQSSNRVFNRHSVQVVSQFKCQGQAQDLKGVQVPLVFTTR